MLAQNIENNFFNIKVEMKEKEWELLKELDLAIKEGNAKMLSNSTKLICQGRAEAYLNIYEKLFGALHKNKDGSLDTLRLKYKVEYVLEELKKFLKA